MTSRHILYLTEDDVSQCITMREAVALSKEGIQADAAGQVAGDKFYMHVSDAGFIKSFSGYLVGEGLAFTKTFSFYEGNPAMGLPTTSSMVLLFEADTGLPACLMEGGWITATKTGASTAVTAEYLARADSKVACIFGAGQQGRTHLEGLSQVFDLAEARIVDAMPDAAAQYAEEMGAKLGLPVVVPQAREAAVRGADIVVTVTTGNEPMVHTAWLKPGAFVAKMGSYQEVELSLLTAADKVIVDCWKYVRPRVPELITLGEQDLFSEKDIHAEWPEVVGGRAPGRESDEEVILYIALGIWGEYAAILPHVYRRAVELGLGIRLPASF
jgi:ornithine cyclodeaminase/alanine dehydrogenase-like protein (mu-crystallin family)